MKKEKKDRIAKIAMTPIKSVSDCKRYEQGDGSAINAIKQLVMLHIHLRHKKHQEVVLVGFTTIDMKQMRTSRSDSTPLRCASLRDHPLTLDKIMKVHHLIKITYALSILILLCGCQTTKDRIEEASKQIRKTGGSLYSPTHYMNDERREALSLLSDELGKPLTTEGKGFTYNAIADINRDYGEYIDLLTVGRAVTNVYYDTLNLGLTGAATAVTPASTKTVLAGLSTFFQGQKQSVDKNIFDDKAIFALTSIMEVRRSQILTAITKKLNSSTYTLGEALIDLDSLYRAGSLQTALQAAFLNQSITPTPTSKGTESANPEPRELLPAIVTPLE